MIVNFVDLKALDMPVYDGDIESSTGIPQSILELNQQMTKADAVIISTPEYNGSIPGGLGAVRSLWHTRVPFEVMGTYVYPNMFGLAKAHTLFDENGNITDVKTIDSLDKLFKEFFDLVRK